MGPVFLVLVKTEFVLLSNSGKYGRTASLRRKKLDMINFPSNPSLLSRDLFLNGIWKMREQQCTEANSPAIKFLILNTFPNTSITRLFSSIKIQGIRSAKQKLMKLKTGFPAIFLCLLSTSVSPTVTVLVNVLHAFLGFCFTFTHFFRGVNPMGCQRN